MSCRVVSCRVVSCPVLSCRVLSCWEADYLHVGKLHARVYREVVNDQTGGSELAGGYTLLHVRCPDAQALLFALQSTGKVHTILKHHGLRLLPIITRYILPEHPYLSMGDDQSVLYLLSTTRSFSPGPTRLLSGYMRENRPALSSLLITDYSY